MTMTLTINGIPCQWEGPPGTTLLELLRARGLMGAKEGCDTGNCGLCTVWLDGEPVLSCCVPAARAEGRQVTLELRGGKALARGVPQILEEILYNLCDNAVAYNRPGGSVTVTVEETAQGARVAVADTGVGIPPEARERVFERFYRLDKSRSSGGTGLGLSIVKHGAAYLGAKLSLESQVGVGSTFTVEFPKV